MLAVLRGGVSPIAIFLSVSLGFWFGVMPGWSGLHTVIVILIFVLNIHSGLFLLSAAAGKGLCLAAAPVMFHIGVLVQSYLSAFLGIVSSIPVIGMTDFSRYSVAGGMVVGPVVGVICGLLLARAVIAFRRMLLKVEEGSEKFKKWYSNRWVRALDRLLVGKRTKEAKALFTGKSKVFRKTGVVIAGVFLAASVVVTLFVKDETIRDYVAERMTRANGAEVNLESLKLSALTADLSVAGIEVTDREKPENNQLSIEKVTADASLYNLLLGKVVMDDVEVSNVKLGQRRAVPGKVVERDREEESAVFKPDDFEIGAEQIGKLETYFRNAKGIKKWVEKVRKWLPKEAQTAKKDKEVPQRYLDYLTARAAVPASPRILAKKVVLDKFEIPWSPFDNSRVVLRNVSDCAEGAGLPVGIEIKSYDTGASAEITFDYGAADGTENIAGTFAGLDLKRMFSGETNRLIFDAGKASGQVEGRITNELIDLKIDVTVRDMKARAGGGILGLDSKTTLQALDVLEEVKTTIRVVGPVREPRLVFDTAGLQDAIKDALVKAGKKRLTEEIDKQIGEQLEKKLGDKVPGGAKEALKKSKELLEGLGGILRKNKDK